MSCNQPEIHNAFFLDSLDGNLTEPMKINPVNSEFLINIAKNNSRINGLAVKSIIESRHFCKIPAVSYPVQDWSSFQIIRN